MSRLIPIIRNSFIRLEGLLYQLFGFVKQIFVWLNQQLKSLAKLLGLAESQYFLEDEAQRQKTSAAEPELPASTPQNFSPTANSTRRRPDTSMDYFRKLAQQVKTSK